METEAEFTRLRRQLQAMQRDQQADRQDLPIQLLVPMISVGLLVALAMPFFVNGEASASGWSLIGGAFAAGGSIVFLLPPVLIGVAACMAPFVAVIEIESRWAVGTTIAINSLAAIATLASTEVLEDRVGDVSMGGGMVTAIALLVVQVLAVLALHSRAVERARLHGAVAATRARRRRSALGS